MITEIRKNILEATDPVVAHCCNCQNVMGSGVALALRTRFPEVYEADTLLFEKYKELLGQTQLVKVKTRPDTTPIEYVANMYAQRHFGTNARQINYEAFYTCLERLKYDMGTFSLDSVGFPYKIASDRAGGHWPIILQMINHVFSDGKVNLYRI